MQARCVIDQRVNSAQRRCLQPLIFLLCSLFLSFSVNAADRPFSATSSQATHSAVPGFAVTGLSDSSARSTSPSAEKRCLLISSYHPGYEWNDGIERGVVSVLQQQCELQRFYMDTKRHPEPAWAEEKAREALALIERYKPDVLLAADDNASKYLVMPYLRDGDLPVVFCGLNWTVSEYGYPYHNATGMVEVAPIIPLLKQVRRILPSVHHALFLSADVATEHKDYEHYRKLFSTKGVELSARFVRNLDDWKQAYLAGQKYDFILLNNNAGIRDWDDDSTARFVLEKGHVLSVTNYEWMVPYVAFAITKVPQEQGEWMASVALSIFDGLSPASIPIIPNRRWEVWVNTGVVQKHKIDLPHSLMLKAKEYP